MWHTACPEEHASDAVLLLLCQGIRRLAASASASVRVESWVEWDER